MRRVILLLGLSILIGCAPVTWVQEGKSQPETRQDLAICVEGLLRGHKITVDSTEEERGKLIAECMEANGYRKRS